LLRVSVFARGEWFHTAGAGSRIEKPVVVVRVARNFLHEQATPKPFFLDKPKIKDEKPQRTYIITSGGRYRFWKSESMNLWGNNSPKSGFYQYP
jgi:hypothetical protein